MAAAAPEVDEIMEQGVGIGGKQQGSFVAKGKDDFRKCERFDEVTKDGGVDRQLPPIPSFPVLFGEEQQRLKQLKAEKKGKALGILKDLLDALTRDGDDEEGLISAEAARWVRQCKRLGVDFASEPLASSI